jgi:hypothetical protein
MSNYESSLFICTVDTPTATYANTPTGQIAYTPAVQPAVLNTIHPSFEFDDDRRTNERKRKKVLPQSLRFFLVVAA